MNRNRQVFSVNAYLTNLPLPEASYYPNVVECAVSVGIVALGILLVYLAIRLVGGLRATEEAKDGQPTEEPV